MKKFLDVSNWNDIREFLDIKNYDGVICKASEGVSYTDKTFDWKIINLKNNGVKVGAYHYLTSYTNPSEQALHFYDVIKPFLPLDIVPVLDIEQNGINEEMVLEFIGKFKAISGMDLLLYSYKYFIEEVFSLNFRKKYNWWIASYTDNKPFVEGCNMIAWQYCDSLKLEGVFGNVDVSELYCEDLFYISFNPSNTNNDKQNYEEYEEHGKATVVVDILNIRDKPSLTSNKVGTYSYGEYFYYDYVIINEGYTWARYIGSSSKEYRYVAVKNLNDNKRYAKCE